jgi:hypothetical protein
MTQELAIATTTQNVFCGLPSRIKMRSMSARVPEYCMTIYVAVMGLWQESSLEKAMSRWGDEQSNSDAN